MVQPRPVVEALSDAGIRSTEPRRAVARLIAARSGHFTARELVRDASSLRTGIGRATIFRTLELFADLGLVERLDLPSGEHAYVACEPAHHHHVICSRCGHSTEVADIGMSEVAREVARRTGYRIERHRLELFGLCPDCRVAVDSALPGPAE
jgi:Fur family ferric uptake transcriptional regulator